MDATVWYSSGRSRRRNRPASILDAIADDVLRDGNVERSLQREFRIGSEDHPGLYDVLNHLAEDIADAESELADLAEDAPTEAHQRLRQRQADARTMQSALKQVESLDDLQGLDPYLMDRTLNQEDQEWIDEWCEITGQLIERGLVARAGSRLVLTPLAIRRIGARMLRHLYVPPVVRGRGAHRAYRRGATGEHLDETSSWEWGQPFDLHLARTIMNAVRRGKTTASITLRPEDFEVYHRESGAAFATVLLIDMSRSMFASGAWDAAKRAAVALDALIGSSLPNDSLHLVGFSGDARALRLADLPSLNWDQFSHGTNLHAGLQVARSVLSRYHGLNRQILILTDGEPTAYMAGDKPIFEHPVTEKTISATLQEAARIARADIGVTTMMLTTDADLTQFVERFSRIVRGRIVFAPSGELGSYVIRDIATGASRSIHTS